jgi:hypothetical protein
MYMVIASLLGVVAAVAHSDRASIDSLKSKYEYCVVGAGPGGMQLGHYMLNNSWDYMVFERNDFAGSFYHRYPRHRQLISLNKRFTGRSDPEFNLRHDWNSLLDQSGVAPMTDRSEERFPNAEILLTYLKDWSKQQTDAGRILYNAEVSAIRRAEEGHFTIKVAHTTQALSKVVTCGSVIMATGLWVPSKPDFVGNDLTIGYDELPEDGRPFQNQKVAVFGLGNSAFETANELGKYTDFVHTFNMRAKGQTRFPFVAWESRYVGNLRAVNAQLLDSYLLKSLDGGFAEFIPLSRLGIFKCGDAMKKKCLFELTPDRGAAMVGHFHKGDKWAEEFLRKVEQYRVYNEWTEPSQSSFGTVESIGAAEKYSTIHTNSPKTVVTYVLLRIEVFDDEALNALVVEFADRSGDFLWQYDTVVRCLGWKHNVSVYESDTVPLLQANEKYAVMNSEYESVNVKGLYFAGTIGHGKDFRRSSGGFIHGFRYTARALFRVLSRKRQQVSGVANPEWPATRRFDVSSPKKLEVLLEHMVERINSASGPYQMVSVLGDGIILHEKNKQVTAEYVEEMPIDYFNEQYAHLPRFMWVFGYNGQAQSLERSFRGTNFEVFVWAYPGCVATDKSNRKELLRLRESVTTEWRSPIFKQHIREFVSDKMKQLTGSKPRTGDASIEKWLPGRVDLWLRNFGNSEVVVYNLDQKDENGASIGKKPLGSLLPGQGKMFFSVDGEHWSIRDKHSNKVLRKWVVDIAHGIVQDVLVGIDSLSSGPRNNQQCARPGRASVL